MSNDLAALKARLEKKANGTSQPPNELDELKQFIRDLYQDSISCEDARDFTKDTQESLEKLIRSWGENPMTPAEYMEAQEAAIQRAQDEREFERLRQKLGK